MDPRSPTCGVPGRLSAVAIRSSFAVGVCCPFLLVNPTTEVPRGLQPADSREMALDIRSTRPWSFDRSGPEESREKYAGRYTWLDALAQMGTGLSLQPTPVPER